MNTYNIVIIGAGPSGFFAAQALQNLENESLEFKVDLIEKMSTPGGLVLYGVAPDHQKIKSVTKVFEKIASHKNLRLITNVEVGVEVTLDNLMQKYDAVVLATGASIGKKLNIPGENLLNYFSSGDFVPWYNSHPNFANLKVDLDCERALVIGAGNVAIDIARILIKKTEDLENTDISIQALNRLKTSKIKKIVICGRRGPEYAQFSTSELRELLKISYLNIEFERNEIQEAIARAKSNGLYEDKRVRNNLDLMLQISESQKINKEKSLIFKFLANPYKILGNKYVSKIQFKLNKFKENQIVQTDESIYFNCGLVVSAIGYESSAIDSLKLSQGKLENSEGKIANNLYVVGWAKRGSNGVIGTNKSDASEVMNFMLKFLNNTKPKNH